MDNIVWHGYIRAERKTNPNRDTQDKAQDGKDKDDTGVDGKRETAIKVRKG